MGKRLISQARGRGGPRYRSPKHKFKGKTSYPSQENIKCEIKDLIRCPAHNAPLAKIVKENNEIILIIAAEGIKVGTNLEYGSSAAIKPGNIMKLKDIPEGTKIFNIESQPGDNGKFCKAAGAFAKVIGQAKNKVTVQFSSKKIKEFQENCRASIGTVAGSGITDKPILKAGINYRRSRAKNRLYPSVSGTSMNAVDHPFGGSKSTHKGRPTVVPHGAPPGRKVGKLKARRTGRKKGRQE
ncbi:MAG: 50S ribosomal protein L2 [Nanoarchaeota archaeon]|nr:50S ribosomal protein L2 [Nanoarchaeota archaeon]